MNQNHRNILQNLKLHNQIRFLVYLYWLKFREHILLMKPRRARIHWVGYHRRRAHPERFLIVLLFGGAVIILKPYEFAVWAAVAGGTTALFVVMVTIYLLIPHKRQHWI